MSGLSLQYTGENTGQQKSPADEKKPEYKIFLDMDGVLSDFDRGCRELCEPGLKPKWDGIRKVDHFYDKLELMPGGQLLFDRIYKKFGADCMILTGVPKPHQHILYAAEDKRAWVSRLLSPEVVVYTVLKEEKKDFVTGPECILIDDHGPNIEDWILAGGTGILHKSTEETIRKLETMGIL